MLYTWITTALIHVSMYLMASVHSSRSHHPWVLVVASQPSPSRPKARTLWLVCSDVIHSVTRTQQKVAVGTDLKLSLQQVHPTRSFSAGMSHPTALLCSWLFSLIVIDNHTFHDAFHTMINVLLLFYLCSHFNRGGYNLM